MEKQCLMTRRERELSIRKFSIFDGVDNVNKFHLPYFDPLVFQRGQYLYQIDDKPTNLYLLVEG